MANRRRSGRRECPRPLTGQCFSIISVFIVTAICAQAAEALTVTSVPRIRAHESSTHDKKPLLLKGSSPSPTTLEDEEMLESAKPTIIIPSPGAVALLVPRQEVDAHRNGTLATKNDKYPVKGVRGGNVVADTPSTVPEAFIATTTTTKSGRMMSSGTATATERTTTSEPDDVESYPQNDQPAYFGQRQQQEDVDEGLDSGRGGGYNYGNDKMSNGMAGSSTASQQTKQRGHGAAADSGNNNNSNNNKSGDYGKGLANVDTIQCPSFTENSACPCYKFDDGE